MIQLGVLASACASPVARAALTASEATAGVRLALERWVNAAVDRLGRRDGFLGNPKVRIPLPGALDRAAGLLKATGKQKRVDALLTAMNRAAEAAVPEARTLLLSAARSIRVDDALAVVRAGDTSVSAYFARNSRAPLTQQFLPIVAKQTDKLALTQKYDAAAGKAMALGLLKKEEAQLDSYVTVKALDGLFMVIGEEERKLRQDPLGAGSQLLKKLFGR